MTDTSTSTLDSLIQRGNAAVKATASTEDDAAWAEGLRGLESAGVNTDPVQSEQKKLEEFQKWFEAEKKTLEAVLKPMQQQIKVQFLDDVKNYGMARFKINTPSSSGL